MANEFGTGPLGFGSLSSMLESVDMVKKAWSGFSLPASLSPTMDIGELDKRIADLKTVEQWLNMNLSLLRGTIQGMEVQRGTLAAIKAFGRAVSARGDAMGAFTAAAQAAAQAATQAAARAAGGSSRDTASAEPSTDAPDAPGGQASSRAGESRRPASGGATDAADAAPAAESGADSAPASSLAQDLSQAAAAAVNPATWWNLLQGQFAQVAQAAMAGAANAAPDASATTAATTKPAAARRGRAATAAPKAGAAAARRGAKAASAAKAAPQSRPRIRTRTGG
jgi:hypothetical protein